MKVKQENRNLQDEIDRLSIRLEFAGTKPDTDTWHLQNEPTTLQQLTDSILAKFQEPLFVDDKYSSAMEEFLKASKYTAQCCESFSLSKSV